MNIVTTCSRQRQDDTFVDSAGKTFQKPKKNTENFNPCHDPPEMRILAAPAGLNKLVLACFHSGCDFLLLSSCH